MKIFILSALALFAAGTLLATEQPPTPVVALEGDWVFQPQLSDEFDAPELDLGKWDNRPDHWGTWSWAPDNAYVKDGTLRIATRYEPHQLKNPRRWLKDINRLFFTSGMIRSREGIKFGYFEARIKAAPIAPGKIAPAFWLTRSDHRKSIEIDIVELIEVPGNPRQIKTNTHIFRHPDLPQEERPGIRFMKGRNRWELHEQHPVNLDTDPREDFLVYSCLWTEEEIRWYVDGRLVRVRPNEYWDIEQDIILSTGLRGDLRTNTTDPSPDGFPTEFEVDYLRVWRRATDQ